MMGTVKVRSMRIDEVGAPNGADAPAPVINIVLESFFFLAVRAPRSP